jgi:hypothetical protein
VNKKLLILNLALVAAVATVGVRIRDGSRVAQTHAAATLGKKVARVPAPPYSPLAPAPPVTAAGYVEIAQKMLFDPSRNSQVIVEPPPPPPPPPPMPALPKYRGQMNLGDGVIASLADAGNGKYQFVKVGEDIGPFKLVAANKRELAFEWNGQVIRKSVDELQDHSIVQAAAPAAAAGAAPPPTVVVPLVKREIGPGAEMSNGYKACEAGDSYANGTVVGGYKKSVMALPFGEDCKWVPAQR